MNNQRKQTFWETMKSRPNCYVRSSFLEAPKRRSFVFIQRSATEVAGVVNENCIVRVRRSIHGGLGDDHVGVRQTI